jgi:hypothetical protein
MFHILQKQNALSDPYFLNICAHKYKNFRTSYQLDRGYAPISIQNSLKNFYNFPLSSYKVDILLNNNVEKEIQPPVFVVRVPSNVI